MNIKEFLKDIWEKTADAFSGLSEKLMLKELYQKYGKYLLPATAGLIIVAMFTSALILDKGAAEGKAEQAAAEEEQAMSIDITDAVYIPAVVIDNSGETEAFFEEDEVVYDGGYMEGDTLSSDYEGETKSVLSQGDREPIVAQIQERLMELGYMDQDIPTDYFGPATEAAVERFQMKNELTVDGNVGEATKTLLFSAEAKKYSMSVGMEGEDVRELQSILRNLGYLNASATGYFGTDTETAVKNFQQKNGLTADGSAGSATLEKLYSGDVTANYIGFGEEGDTILALQKKLRSLGYLTTEPDGKYGADTVQAVKRFQENHGLIVDGYFGYDTKVLLNSGDAEANAFSIGDRGTQVENIQRRLVALKYLKKATGYYGEDTEAAVRAFQKRNGLSQDGKVGQQTLKVLLSDNAKKAAANSSSSTSSTKKPTTTKKPTSTKKPTTTKTPEKVQVSGANVSSLIAVAKSKLGCKYVRGGKGPNTFDCSGFVYWCLREIGVKISYMTSAGWKSCTKYETITSMSEIKAGDIIVFKGHVGIAIGNGQMIDASSSEGKIRYGNLSHSYWKKNFIKACRLF
ncbi:MAG: peptidoglycan-binding protein [Christensenellaceae bacterium]|nr:peptidoglycan-binding protein [Christensenellaceae bacterium]